VTDRRREDPGEPRRSGAHGAAGAGRPSTTVPCRPHRPRPPWATRQRQRPPRRARPLRLDPPATVASGGGDVGSRGGPAATSPLAAGVSPGRARQRVLMGKPRPMWLMFLLPSLQQARSARSRTHDGGGRWRHQDNHEAVLSTLGATENQRCVTAAGHVQSKVAGPRYRMATSPASSGWGSQRIAQSSSEL
jgi:hypothetical protein